MSTQSLPSRRRPRRALGAIALATLTVATSCSSGAGAEADADRRTLERRLDSPVYVAFSVERTIFSNGADQLAAYQEGITDVIDGCVTITDRSCRLVTYASDAGSMAGRTLPSDDAFRGDDGFYSLDTDATDISIETAEALRLRRGRGYRDAVQADLESGRDQGCVDPFSGLRSALGALAGVEGDRHVVVMGSGLWNCPPLAEVLTSEGERLLADQAIADALTMIEEDAAQDVTFHFVRFGETFVGEWVVMTRDEIAYLEDIWTVLVERWGGDLAAAPREEMTFP
jgi:hypothetical protein